MQEYLEKRGILTEHMLGESTVWLLRLQDLTGEEYAEMYFRLSGERQKKADGIRAEWKRKQSVGAGYLLYLLKKRFSIEEEPVVLPGGKPAFPGNGEIFFNLSHSGKYAGLAYGKRNLGLDMESVKRADLRVAKRFFRKEEYEYLASLEDGAGADAFCRIWTGKEAVLKAAGKGISASLDGFSVLGGALDASGTEDLCVETEISRGEDRYGLCQRRLTEKGTLLWVSVAVLHEC